MRRWLAQIQENEDKNLPQGFSWVEEKRLAGSSVPECRDQLEALVKEGGAHLVSLSPESLPPSTPIDGLNITFIPVEDFEAPNSEDFRCFFELCERAHALDQAVAVHCRGGSGRTGTMLAAYFIWRYNYNAEEAVKFLRTTRPWSVESQNQMEALARLHQVVGDAGARDETSALATLSQGDGSLVVCNKCKFKARTKVELITHKNEKHKTIKCCCII